MALGRARDGEDDGSSLRPVTCSAGERAAFSVLYGPFRPGNAVQKPEGKAY
jgi:hypothetical protein